MSDLSLLKELAPSDQEIQQRLKLVDFGPADAKRVRDLADVVTPHAEDFTSAFLDHLLASDATSRLRKERPLVDEIRRLKNDHLRAMTEGKYDARYVEERLRLAALYARAGVEPRAFLGAFHQLMRTVGIRVMESRKKDPTEGFEAFMSLKKVAFFDLSLIVDALVLERERLIRQQQEAIRELSTPVMQLRDRLLILPIIGVIDTQRAKQLTEDLLHGIRANRAKVVVMDITGVPIVDSKVANHLVQSIMAARLMGAATVVTGLSAQVAQALVTLGVDVSKLNTVGDLQGGLEEAERMLGYKVIRDETAGAAAAGDAR